MASSDKYDFFVSYARKDNATGWITNFVDELLAEHQQFAAGRELVPFFDKNDIGAGADWQHTLTDGIAHSKLFVAFISPNYFASEWCRKEWRAWIDAEIAKHIFTAGVRPVYIVEVPGLTDGKLSEHDFSRQMAEFLKLSGNESAKLLAETPPVVKHLRRRQMTHNQPFCDVHSFYTEGVETLRRDDLRQVLSKLAQDLDHHAELLAKADASVTTIPPYNRNFSGRHDELLQLREWLTKDDRTGVIHGVHGLGGIGKTELALTYAHGYASAYPGGRFLISCDGKSSLRDAILTQHDFTSLFTDRISDEQRKDSAEYYAAVMRHLSHRLDNLGHVLLLLDNVTDTALLTREQTDAVTKLGPKLHLLVTTRLPAPATHKDNWISLDRLPDEDALELLEKHWPFADTKERDAAQHIVKQLGGFTLAIELIAAWLAANESSSYVRIKGGLNLDELEEIADDKSFELRRHNHERRLTSVLGPILDSLKPAERLALEFAAILPGDQVPLPWLKQLVTLDFPGLAQEGKLKNPWDEVWQSLEKLSLFSRTDDNTFDIKLLRIHQLVKELVNRRINDDVRDTRMMNVLTLVNERLGVLIAMPKFDHDRWELKAFNTLSLNLLESEHIGGIELQKYLGNRWCLLNEWIDAEKCLRRALTAIEKLRGEDSYETVEYLEILATLFRDTCRYSEAEELLSRALNISKKQFESNNINLVSILVSMAALLQCTGRLAEAEQFSSRALEISIYHYGKTNLKNATIYNNHALLLKTLGRLEESEVLFRQLLVLLENEYGVDSPLIVKHLNNLADLLLIMGCFDEAETLYRRAIKVKENNLELGDSDIATSFDGLAALLRNTNRTKEAEPLIRRALTIREEIHGPYHPAVATSLNNLALMLYECGIFHDSEPLFRRGLAIYEARYGLNHTDVATNLCNLALTLMEIGDLDEAEKHYRRALEIYEDKLGHNHPQVETTLNSLVWVLWKAERFTESEPFFRRMLPFYKKKQGVHYHAIVEWVNKLDTLPEIVRMNEMKRFMQAAFLSQEKTQLKSKNCNNT